MIDQLYLVPLQVPVALFQWLGLAFFLFDKISSLWRFSAFLALHKNPTNNLYQVLQNNLKYMLMQQKYVVISVKDTQSASTCKYEPI